MEETKFEEEQIAKLRHEAMEVVMPTKEEKVVAIVSGGVDSSTLLYWLYFRREEDAEICAITFLYGQRHAREIEAAQEICGRLGIEHHQIDISSIQPLIDSSALTFGQEVPEVEETAEHYETLKQTIVPNRNSILLSIAVGHAVSIGAKRVYYGPHASDRGVYPDCRKEFVDAFQHAERLATDVYDLEVIAPFVEFEKSDIVNLGDRLKVPYEVTWTCYRGGEVHCGLCSACRERKRAFEDAGVPDPTEYALNESDV